MTLTAGAQRLPEVKGFLVTTGVPGHASLRIMIPVGISLLDPEEDEVARGLTPVTAHLGPVDLATLDADHRGHHGQPRGERALGPRPASANGPPTRGSASGHENWTSSKPTSNSCRPAG